MEFSLGEIDQQIFSELVHTISEATGVIFHETMESLELETKNCRHFLQWDILHKELLKRLHGGHLVAVLKRRGPWGFVLLYDAKSNTIISLLKKKRLSALQTERRRRLVPHYMDALTYLNKDLPAQQERLGQAFEERSAPYIQEVVTLLHSLCAGFELRENSSSVPRHVLICFDNRGVMITSINAYVLNSMLEIVEEQDLSEYLAPDIGFVESQLDAERVVDPRLKLKSKALDRAGKSTHRKLRPSQSDEVTGESS
jgi:hypothetical protein